MKKVLILGCGEKTELLVSRLCSDGRCVSEICLASKNKNECNAIKNKVASGNVRIITSGIDVTNTEGAMMMANIFGPDLIINLMPPELTEHVLCLALNVKAAYLDFKIDNVPVYPKEDDVLGTQFRYFAHFSLYHNLNQFRKIGEPQLRVSFHTPNTKVYRTIRWIYC